MFGSLRVVVWTPRDDEIRIISVGNRQRRKEGHMKKEYDFSKGKRGAVIPRWEDSHHHLSRRCDPEALQGGVREELERGTRP